MHSPLTYLKSEPIFAQRRRAARPRTRYTTEATACSSSRCQLSTHGAYSHTADMCASTDAGDGKGRVVQPGCITTTGKTRRRRAQVGQVATAAHKIWNTDEVNARRNSMYITDVLTCSLRRAREDAADVPRRVVPSRAKNGECVVRSRLCRSTRRRRAHFSALSRR